MPSIVAAALVLGGLVVPAPGADLGGPRGVPGYPAYAPALPIWSGFYLGVHGGYASAHASSTTFDGFLGGLQGGYNAEVARNVILGLEMDLSGADIGHRDAATLFGIAASATTRTYLMGSARARLGYTFDRFMIYGTGGFIWAVNEIRGTFGAASGSDTNVHTGYTFGAGMEWMIAPAWTARAEYLYASLGSERYFGIPRGNASANMVRIGVNYLFR
jgi:outer membrane immunogenic protein